MSGQGDREPHHPEAATITAMCRYYLRLGLLGFGGPVALAGSMQRDLVEERGWVSQEEYRDGLAIAQMAPGPLAAQLAMWLAFVRGGIRGATLASFAFAGPSFLLVVALAWLYVALGRAHWVGSLFYGVAPATVAIIALSSYRLLPLTVGRSPSLAIAAGAAGLATYFTGSEVPLVVLGAGLSVTIWRLGPRLMHRLIGDREPSLAIGIGAIGLLTPSSAGDPGMLATLAVFFASAGAFVFGSGLAIVPFLHQGIVVEHGWLTEQQFLDAVAVGLITPGPVVITAAFIGYLVAGVPGAIAAAVGVFLPVYAFVVLPGRWFLRHKDDAVIRAFVAGVSAAAAGAIVAATVMVGRQAIRDPATLLIGLASLAGLLVIRRRGQSRVGPVADPLIVATAGLVGLALQGI